MSRVKLNSDHNVSKKNVKWVYHNKYKYKYLREMTNGDMTFRCIRNSCSAKIDLDRLLKKIIRCCGEHQHEIENYEDTAQNIATSTVIKHPEFIPETDFPIKLNDDVDDNIQISLISPKKKKTSTVLQSLEEAPEQNFEMPRNRFVEFDDFCVDEDGNEIIVLHETNSVPEETEENNIGGYKYIMSKGQTIDNNGARYQYINAPNNNMEQNSSGSSIFKATSSVQKPAARQSVDVAEWKDDETKLMLKRYREYILHVGKDKRFKNKREVWNAIAEEINNTFNVGRSSNQCMSKFFHKFQSMKKTKKPLEGLVNFQDELDSIDSIHEVIMEDLEAAKMTELDINREVSNSEALISQVLPKTLVELAKINAYAHERRHREYMELIKGFEARFMNNIATIIDKM